MSTLKEILDYNDKTIGQSHEFSIFLLSKRLQIIGKSLLKENDGIHGFRMGRDYHTKMKMEDRTIEFLRPQFMDQQSILKNEANQ